MNNFGIIENAIKMLIGEVETGEAPDCSICDYLEDCDLVTAKAYKTFWSTVEHCFEEWKNFSDDGSHPISSTIPELSANDIYNCSRIDVWRGTYGMLRYDFLLYMIKWYGNANKKIEEHKGSFSELKRILVELEDKVYDNTVDGSTSICDYVHNNADGEVLAAWENTIEIALTLWKYFFGNKRYPIPGGQRFSYDPKYDFEQLKENGLLWHKEYGSFRRDLLNHLISFYGEHTNG